ncbi:MAG: sensor histidine kinase [Pseudooceanicola nanhaiensis]
MRAEEHPSNTARLRALRDYDILDTEPEAMFDDIVHLASAICDMPVSIISLVDADRQWFKAEVGLGLKQTGLDESICSHAILTDGFLEIRDATKDLRTRDNPLVLGDEKLRFYAGAVLKTPEGLPVGSLCVLDREPRELTDLQRQTLRVLARQVTAQLDLRRALKEADVLRREVEHRVKNSLQSIASLTRIQASRAETPEVKEALDIVDRRLKTVALLHETLYRSENDGRVDMSEFVDQVAGLIQGSAPENIRIESVPTDAVISSNQAAALGVILNEFATNTFKHAFPDGRPGVLKFEADCEDDSVSMICTDNGVGINGARSERSIGLVVMEASASQMRAEYELSSNADGTRLSLTFPADC